MYTPTAPSPARWKFPLALALLAGCSALAGCSTSGGRLSFFPQGHRLIDAAKAMRSANPDPAPLPRELDKRIATPYVVEPGDVVLIQPANLESPIRLPGDQAVLPDGTIQLGQYGRLLVAGKTLEEIETAAKALIQTQVKDAGPITARLITRVSKVYYVLGEVNAPGSFPLQGREDVLDAIIAAGGLTERASRKNIILSRPTAPHSCRVVLPICYNEIVQLGDTSTNYQIAAGDRIYVPTREPHENGGLFHKPTTCPPCGGPQAPCTIGPDGKCVNPAPAAAETTVLPPGSALPAPAPGPGSPVLPEPAPITFPRANPTAKP